MTYTTRPTFHTVLDELIPRGAVTRPQVGRQPRLLILGLLRPEPQRVQVHVLLDVLHRSLGAPHLWVSIGVDTAGLGLGLGQGSGEGEGARRWR